MKKQVTMVPMDFCPKGTDDPKYISVGKWSVMYNGRELFKAYMYADGSFFLINSNHDRVFMGRNGFLVWSISLHADESIQSIAQEVVNRLYDEPDHDAEATAAYVNQDR